MPRLCFCEHIGQQNHHQRGLVWAEETVQWVKCCPCKHEDHEFHRRIQVKMLGVALYPYNLSPGAVETRGFLGFTGKPTSPLDEVTSERPCLKLDGV